MPVKIKPNLLCHETPAGWDVVVVGLGPAGVACMLQIQREGFQVLGVSDQPVGGLLPAARRLDNFPGLPAIAGSLLADHLRGQLETQALPVLVGVSVTEVQREQTGYTARLQSGGSLRTRAVCLCVGTCPRPWGQSESPVPRDIRDLPVDLAGRRVVVIGGGEAALDTALSVHDRGGRAEVFSRRETFLGSPRLWEEAHRAGIGWQGGVEPPSADPAANGWRLTFPGGNSACCDHLVVCIGREPRRDLGLPPEPGPGLLWAGDVRAGRDRYAITAMGDGARAALQLSAFLRGEA